MYTPTFDSKGFNIRENFEKVLGDAKRTTEICLTNIANYCCANVKLPTIDKELGSKLGLSATTVAASLLIAAGSPALGKDAPTAVTTPTNIPASVQKAPAPAERPTASSFTERSVVKAPAIEKQQRKEPAPEIRIREPAKVAIAVEKAPVVTQVVKRKAAEGSMDRVANEIAQRRAEIRQARAAQSDETRTTPTAPTPKESTPPVTKIASAPAENTPTKVTAQPIPTASVAPATAPTNPTESSKAKTPEPGSLPKVASALNPIPATPVNPDESNTTSTQQQPTAPTTIPSPTPVTPATPVTKTQVAQPNINISTGNSVPPVQFNGNSDNLRISQETQINQDKVTNGGDQQVYVSPEGLAEIQSNAQKRAFVGGEVPIAGGGVLDPYSDIGGSMIFTAPLNTNTDFPLPTGSITIRTDKPQFGVIPGKTTVNPDGSTTTVHTGTISESNTATLGLFKTNIVDTTIKTTQGNQGLLRIYGQAAISTDPDSNQQYRSVFQGNRSAFTYGPGKIFGSQLQRGDVLYSDPTGPSFGDFGPNAYIPGIRANAPISTIQIGQIEGDLLLNTGDNFYIEGGLPFIPRSESESQPTYKNIQISQTGVAIVANRFSSFTQTTTTAGIDGDPNKFTGTTRMTIGNYGFGYNTSASPFTNLILNGVAAIPGQNDGYREEAKRYLTDGTQSSNPISDPIYQNGLATLNRQTMGTVTGLLDSQFFAGPNRLEGEMSVTSSSEQKFGPQYGSFYVVGTEGRTERTIDFTTKYNWTSPFTLQNRWNINTANPDVTGAVQTEIMNGSQINIARFGANVQGVNTQSPARGGITMEILNRSGERDEILKSSTNNYRDILIGGIFTGNNADGSLAIGNLGDGTFRWGVLAGVQITDPFNNFSIAPVIRANGDLVLNRGVEEQKTNEGEIIGIRKTDELMISGNLNWKGLPDLANPNNIGLQLGQIYYLDPSSTLALNIATKVHLPPYPNSFRIQDSLSANATFTTAIGTEKDATGRPVYAATLGAGIETGLLGADRSANIGVGIKLGGVNISTSVSRGLDNGSGGEQINVGIPLDDKGEWSLNAGISHVIDKSQFQPETTNLTLGVRYNPQSMNTPISQEEQINRLQNEVNRFRQQQLQRLQQLKSQESK